MENSSISFFTSQTFQENFDTSLFFVRSGSRGGRPTFVEMP